MDDIQTLQLSALGRNIEVELPALAICWTPFLSGDTDAPIECLEYFRGLTDQEVRAYCVSLRADVRIANAALTQCLAALAHVAEQLTRCRERNRQLRDWNNELAATR